MLCTEETPTSDLQTLRSRSLRNPSEGTAAWDNTAELTVQTQPLASSFGFRGRKVVIFLDV